MPETHQQTNNTERFVNAVFRRLSEAHHESFSEAASWLAARFNIPLDLAQTCVQQAIQRWQHPPFRSPSSRCLRGPRSESSAMWENGLRAWEDRDEGIDLLEICPDKENL